MAAPSKKYYVLQDATSRETFVVPGFSEADATASLIRDLPDGKAGYIRVDPRFMEPFNSATEAGRALARGYDARNSNDAHPVSKSAKPSDLNRPDPTIKKAAEQHRRITERAKEQQAADARIDRAPDTLAESDHHEGQLPDSLAESDQAKPPEKETAPRDPVKEVLQRGSTLAGDAHLAEMQGDNHELLTGKRTVAVVGPKDLGIDLRAQPGQVSAILAELQDVLVSRMGDEGLHVVTNLDRGFDMLTAQAALKLKQQGLPVTLEVHAPYQARPSLWNDDATTFYDIVAQADKVTYERVGKSKPDAEGVRRAVDGARNEIVMAADEVLTFRPPNASDKSVGAAAAELADVLGIPVTNTYDRLAGAGADNKALGTLSLMTPPTAQQRTSMVRPGEPAGSGAPAKMERRVMPPAAGEPLPGSSARTQSGPMGDRGNARGAVPSNRSGTASDAPSSVSNPRSQVVPVAPGSVVPPPAPPARPDIASQGSPDPVSAPAQRPPMPSLSDPPDFATRMRAMFDGPTDVAGVEALVEEARQSKFVGFTHAQAMRHAEYNPLGVNAHLTLALTGDDALGRRISFQDALEAADKLGHPEAVKQIRQLMPAVTVTDAKGSPKTADAVIGRTSDQPSATVPTPPSVEGGTPSATVLPGAAPEAPAGIPGMPEIRRTEVQPTLFPETRLRPARVSLARFESSAQVALGMTPMSHAVTGVLGQAFIGTALSRLFLPSETASADGRRAADQASGAVKEMLTTVAASDPRVSGLMLSGQISHMGRYEASKTLAEVALGATLGTGLAMGAERLASGRGPATRQLAGLAAGAMGWLAAAVIAPGVVNVFERLRGAGAQQLNDGDMGLMETAAVGLDRAAMLSQQAAEQFELEFADADGNELDLDDDSEMPSAIDEVVDGDGEPLDYEIE